jgi:uncharacterized protein (TIGR02145 family)
MKKAVTLLALILFTLGVFSQTPKRMSYQAIVRNSGGELVKSTTVGIKISILQSTSDGTVVYSETHTPLTNPNGLATLEIGGGSVLTGTYSTINWASGPYFIKTEIDPAGNTNYTIESVSQLLSVPYALVADNLSGPVGKLEVASKTIDMEEPLFEVKNKEGKTVFAVYNEGVRIYVDDGSKGSKGGFAIGGFGTTKAPSQPLLVVNPDSIRAYIGTNPSTKGSKGGFAIGGFGGVKAVPEEYIRITRDSTRVYLNDSGTKASKGGFAVGSFNHTKAASYNYLSVSPDSTRVYVRKLSPTISSTFDIVGIGLDQTRKSMMKASSDTVNIKGVLNLQNNLIVTGNVNIGGAVTNDPSLISDIEGNAYKTISIGTQTWMAENLKTTKYNDGTAIPNITDGTAWAALTTGAYSDYDNTPANSTTYGRLYNWYAVDNNALTKVASNGGKNVCPTGWHIPSDAEWTTLTTFLGGEAGAGGKLKETGTTHWESPNDGATNETGFTALPGGYRGNSGSFDGVGIYGYCWSSTEFDAANAWYRTMYCYNQKVDIYSFDKSYGYSVRCIKD